VAGHECQELDLTKVRAIIVGCLADLASFAKATIAADPAG
jgi:hypothetical protein